MIDDTDGMSRLEQMRREIVQIWTDLDEWRLSAAEQGLNPWVQIRFDAAGEAASDLVSALRQIAENGDDVTVTRNPHSHPVH